MKAKLCMEINFKKLKHFILSSYIFYLLQILIYFYYLVIVSALGVSFNELDIMKNV